MTNPVLARDPDFQYIVNNIKAPGLNKGKSLMLRAKCIEVLTKFGNRRWSEEIETIANIFGALTFEIQNPGYFFDRFRLC